jgi:NADH-quinone oxidoreductase subunit E
MLQPVAKEATEAIAPLPVINEPALPIIEITAPVAPLTSEPAQQTTATPPLAVATLASSTNGLASRAFATELAAGTVRCDSSLGMLYAERPDRWDDLTLMRGVAEITQQKLHDCGIYTFKQIAVWDDRTMREVGQATHVGDRIARDRWAQQARDLHYLKYGEKLG